MLLVRRDWIDFSGQESLLMMARRLSADPNMSSTGRGRDSPSSPDGNVLSSKESVEDFVRRWELVAESHARCGSWNDVIECCNKILQIPGQSRSNFNALHLIGIAYMKLGQGFEAFVNLVAARDINPQHDGVSERIRELKQDRKRKLTEEFWESGGVDESDAISFHQTSIDTEAMPGSFAAHSLSGYSYNLHSTTQKDSAAGEINLNFSQTLTKEEAKPPVQTFTKLPNALEHDQIWPAQQPMDVKASNQVQAFLTVDESSEASGLRANPISANAPRRASYPSFSPNGHEHQHQSSDSGEAQHQETPSYRFNSSSSNSAATNHFTGTTPNDLQNQHRQQQQQYMLLHHTIQSQQPLQAGLRQTQEQTQPYLPKHQQQLKQSGCKPTQLGLQQHQQQTKLYPAPNQQQQLPLGHESIPLLPPEQQEQNQQYLTQNQDFLKQPNNHHTQMLPHPQQQEQKQHHPQIQQQQGALDLSEDDRELDQEIQELEERLHMLKNLKRLRAKRRNLLFSRSYSEE
ncbi:hypothetical protein HJC23_001585 [Cyclotella cryptica]|uniref:Uncharacterized protein n=1 Tax=Cyclotella cryptica TaxID=29204 RepID=A0ABD3NT02_9STRA|eukprot:CCRYP_020084-RA/>CCRYP_020084-RA protein AED:0.38 eAED:0.38 QI:0/-1/0/1/-1/1/1/0/515